MSVTSSLGSISGRAAATASSRSDSSSPSDPLFESPATLDVFSLGRRAADVRNQRWGATASFVRARQWLPSGAWRGPRDASESYVELADLDAGGGWSTVAAAGVDLLVGDTTPAIQAAVFATGGRILQRFPFRAGEPASERRARLGALRALVDSGVALWGIMPSPMGEAEGIDTLRVVAALRLDLPAIPHVVLDVAALGPRLAQMALGFGGDELWAPIVSERALRLGGNANNPSMTRKEAGILIRGAGLRPRERTGTDQYIEESP